jgi:hypothetical protein
VHPRPRSRDSASVTSATTLRSRVILIARALIDLDLGLHGRPVPLCHGGEKAVLQQAVQLGAIELFRVRELFDRAQHVDRADHLGLPSLTM